MANARERQLRGLPITVPGCLSEWNDMIMTKLESTANENRFLGALLGMAIGDALGMPVTGLTKQEIGERFGNIDGFMSVERQSPPGAKAGEFTDETEVVLCIVESMTTNEGEVDPDNIGARLQYLSHGESRKWLPRATLDALSHADDDGVYRVPLDEDGPASGDVAARGVPIGLMAAVGEFDAVWLRGASEAVCRLTHGSPAAIAATTAVAFGVNLAARDTAPDRWTGETATFLENGELAERLRLAADKGYGAPRSDLLSEMGSGSDACHSVVWAFVVASIATSFESAVFEAVQAGGTTDTAGAIAGALAGARFGASGIPQRLIDDLEGRIYVSLAAPWFYRTALYRSGLAGNPSPTAGQDSPPERPAFPPRQ